MSAFKVVVHYTCADQVIISWGAPDFSTSQHVSSPATHLYATGGTHNITVGNQRTGELFSGTVTCPVAMSWDEVAALYASWDALSAANPSWDEVPY